MERRSVTVRLSEAGIEALDEIAKTEFDGNRSLALRKLLERGLATWPKEKR